MAEVTFFSSFGTKWAQTGNVDPIQDDQYRVGWAYIGSTPPSVEQFNKWGQLSDEKHNWLFAQLKSAADDKNIELSGNDLEGLLKVLRSFGDESPRIKTFAEAIALTENIGPITVIGMDGIWEWSSSQYFTGYRHPHCGEWMNGWTPTPLAFQIPATGGTWREADEKERRVIAQYRERGSVCTVAQWIPGQNMIADLGGGNWKAPDLQNMFKRMSGTDADTANAMLLGLYKSGRMQRIAGGPFYSVSGTSGDFSEEVRGAFKITEVDDGQWISSVATPPVAGTKYALIDFDSSRLSGVGAETAPGHTITTPYIHV